MPNGTRGVHLSWMPPPTDTMRDGGFPIIAYNLYRGAGLGELTYLATVGNVTVYDDLPCAVTGLYTYHVSASTVVGEGPPSQVARSLGINLDPQRSPNEACAEP